MSAVPLYLPCSGSSGYVGCPYSPPPQGGLRRTENHGREVLGWADGPGNSRSGGPLPQRAPLGRRGERECERQQVTSPWSEREREREVDLGMVTGWGGGEESPGGWQADGERQLIDPSAETRWGHLIRE